MPILKCTGHQHGSPLLPMQLASAAPGQRSERFVKQCDDGILQQPLACKPALDLHGLKLL